MAWGRRSARLISLRARTRVAPRALLRCGNGQLAAAAPPSLTIIINHLTTISLHCKTGDGGRAKMALSLQNLEAALRSLLDTTVQVDMVSSGKQHSAHSTA